MKKPIEIKGVVLLEVIVAFMGISSGILLLLDPTGSILGIDFLLQYLPLSDFVLVGLWLLSAFGFLPIAVALGLWLTKRWAWAVSLILGCIEIVWIIVQVFLLYEVGISPMQPFIAGIGAATIFLLLMPASRYYVRRETSV